MQQQEQLLERARLRSHIPGARSASRASPGPLRRPLSLAGGALAPKPAAGALVSSRRPALSRCNTRVAGGGGRGTSQPDADDDVASGPLPRGTQFGVRRCPTKIRLLLTPPPSASPVDEFLLLFFIFATCDCDSLRNKCTEIIIF